MTFENLDRLIIFFVVEPEEKKCNQKIDKNSFLRPTILKSLFGTKVIINSRQDKNKFDLNTIRSMFSTNNLELLYFEKEWESSVKMVFLSKSRK
jgi:hypothetical protein